MKLIVLSLFLAGCSSLALNRTPQSEPLDEAQASRSLEAILRPHVVPLDRDLVTFRYEHDDKNVTNPRTIADVAARETPWAARFFDVRKRTGDDVGPGVFVAVDPNATATWGMTSPHLLVFTIKRGAMFLNGDIDRLTEAELITYRQITERFKCENDDDRKYRPVHTYSELVGAFRNSYEEPCRRMLLSALTRLSLQAIVYNFNSVPLEDCRVTGNAINIVDFGIVDLEHTNYYDQSTRIESDARLTRYVKALFAEGKDDYYAQSLLHDPQLLASYRNGYDFFRDAPAPAIRDYRAWKASHIFKCGPAWSTETDNGFAGLSLAQARTRDPELQNLEIDVAVIYRELIARTKPLPDSVSWEFNVPAVKAVQRFTYLSLGGRAGDEVAFESWRNARITTGGLDDFATIASKFGEKEVNAEDMFNELSRESFASGEKTSDVLQDFLTKRPIGRHGATQIYNFWQFARGGVPYLKGLITPYALVRARRRAGNRRVLMRILRHCREVYTNPRISAEDLTNGECSVSSDRH